MMRIINRGISVLLGILLICGNIARAEPSASSSASVNTSPLSNNIFIPEQYGRIEGQPQTSNLKPQTPRLPQVILVKDAHCNYEAQKNIARILEVLVRDYKIDLVCVEGASGKVDTSAFQSMPDEKARKTASDVFVKKGRLTASEALSISRAGEMPFTIWGVEDARLYVEDLKLFRETIKISEEPVRFLNEAENVINDLKGKVYNSALREFDKKLREYKANELPLTEWLKYSVERRADSAEKKNIRLVLKSIKLEEAVDFKKVEKERTELIRECGKKLPKEEIEQLVKKSLEFRLGKISSLEYYKILEPLVIRYPLNAIRLKMYIHLLKLQSKINEYALFGELNEIEESIVKHLFKNNAEEDIYYTEKKLDILKKIFRLEAGRNELEYYKKNRNEFSIANIAGFLKIEPISERHAVSAEEFYALALKRDRALVENLVNKMQDENKESAVIVAGGFHGEGIKEELKQRNIECVEITPKITKIQKDNPYLNLITNRDMDVDLLFPKNIALPYMFWTEAGGDMGAMKEFARLMIEGKGRSIADLRRKIKDPKQLRLFNKLCEIAGAGEEDKTEQIGKFITLDFVVSYMRGLTDEQIQANGGDAFVDYLLLLLEICSKFSGEDYEDELRKLAGPFSERSSIFRSRILQRRKKADKAGGLDGEKEKENIVREILLPFLNWGNYAEYIERGYSGNLVDSTDGIGLECEEYIAELKNAIPSLMKSHVEFLARRKNLSLREYRNYVSVNAEERERLREDITKGLNRGHEPSYFFRQSGTLKQGIEELSGVIEAQVKENRLKIKIRDIGGFNGMESYELAMLLYDKLEEYGNRHLKMTGRALRRWIAKWDVDIKLYDISIHSMFRAKLARYSSMSGLYKLLPRKYVRRFFPRKNFQEMNALLKKWVSGHYIDLYDAEQLGKLSEEPSDLTVALNILKYIDRKGIFVLRSLIESSRLGGQVLAANYGFDSRMPLCRLSSDTDVEALASSIGIPDEYALKGAFPADGGALADIKKNAIKNGYLYKMVFADGKVDRVAFPGTWDIFIETEHVVSAPAYMRVVKSAALMADELFSCESGEIHIAGRNEKQDSADKVSARLFIRNGKKHAVVCVHYDFLNIGRFEQRRLIKEALERGAGIEDNTDKAKIEGPPVFSGEPAVAFESLHSVTDYGSALLKDELVKRGIRVVDPFDIFDSAVTPNIVCISVLNDTIDGANKRIAQIKTDNPGAFVIIGGPSTRLPEHLAAAIPFADIIIRGEGEEILPEVVKIIGARKADEALTEGQVSGLKELKGGIIIRQNRNRIVINNLDYVNSIDNPELFRPLKRQRAYWLTSRGCPFQCRFCSHPMGKRYRYAGVESKDGRMYMINWLVERLRLELDSPGRPVSYEEMMRILEEEDDLYEKGFFPPGWGKMDIIILDDNFLINRERVIEFCRRARELKLQRYFNFAISQTSINTFFKGSEIDAELIDELWASGFLAAGFGTDALTTKISNQMGKGHTIQQAIVLNREMIKKGFSIYHNVILTTPSSSVIDLTEALMLYYLLPFSYSSAKNRAVLADLGAYFTNAELLNYRKEYLSKEENFGEYDLYFNKELKIADPEARRLVSLFSDEELWRFPDRVLGRELGNEYMSKVIEAWQLSAEPEIRALGMCFRHLSYSQIPPAEAARRLKKDMKETGSISFEEFFRTLPEREQLEAGVGAGGREVLQKPYGSEGISQEEAQRQIAEQEVSEMTRQELSNLADRLILGAQAEDEGFKNAFPQLRDELDRVINIINNPLKNSVRVYQLAGPLRDGNSFPIDAAARRDETQVLHIYIAKNNAIGLFHELYEHEILKGQLNAHTFAAVAEGAFSPSILSARAVGQIGRMKRRQRKKFIRDYEFIRKEIIGRFPKGAAREYILAHSEAMHRRAVLFDKLMLRVKIKFGDRDYVKTIISAARGLFKLNIIERWDDIPFILDFFEVLDKKAGSDGFEPLRAFADAGCIDRFSMFGLRALLTSVIPANLKDGEEKEAVYFLLCRLVYEANKIKDKKARDMFLNIDLLLSIARNAGADMAGAFEAFSRLIINYSAGNITPQLLKDIAGKKREKIAEGYRSLACGPAGRTQKPYGSEGLNQMEIEERLAWQNTRRLRKKELIDLAYYLKKLPGRQSKTEEFRGAFPHFEEELEYIAGIILSAARSGTIKGRVDRIIHKSARDEVVNIYSMEEPLKDRKELPIKAASYYAGDGALNVYITKDNIIGLFHELYEYKVLKGNANAHTIAAVAESAFSSGVSHIISPRAKEEIRLMTHEQLLQFLAQYEAVKEKISNRFVSAEEQRLREYALRYAEVLHKEAEDQYMIKTDEKGGLETVVRFLEGQGKSWLNEAKTGLMKIKNTADKMPENIRKAVFGKNLLLIIASRAGKEAPAAFDAFREILEAGFVSRETVPQVRVLFNEIAGNSYSAKGESYKALGMYVKNIIRLSAPMREKFKRAFLGIFLDFGLLIEIAENEEEKAGNSYTALFELADNLYGKILDETIDEEEMLDKIRLLDLRKLARSKKGRFAEEVLDINKENTLFGMLGSARRRTRNEEYGQMGRRAEVEKIIFDESGRPVGFKVKGREEMIPLSEAVINPYAESEKLKGLCADSGYIPMLDAVLSSFARDGGKIYSFSVLVNDLFGFSSPENGMIALHESAAYNPVAIFHEIGHCLIGTGAASMGLDGQILKVSINGGNFELPLGAEAAAVAEKAEKYPDKRDHYLLRALQREMFGEADRNLTIAIKNKSRSFQRGIRPRWKNYTALSSFPQQAMGFSEKGRDKYEKSIAPGRRWNIEVDEDSLPAQDEEYYEITRAAEGAKDIAGDLFSDNNGEDVLEMISALLQRKGSVAAEETPAKTLTGRVKIKYHSKGKNKIVFRIDFEAAEKEPVSIVLAMKKGKKAGGITEEEIENLKMLSTAGALYTPVFGSESVSNDGSRFYIEEFIEGRTAHELGKSNSLTKDIRKDVARGIMWIYKILGAAPEDIRRANFIISPNVNGEPANAICVDIGRNRITEPGIIVDLTISYYGYSGGDNRFVYEAVLEILGEKEGREFLERTMRFWQARFNKYNAPGAAANELKNFMDDNVPAGRIDEHISGEIRRLIDDIGGLVDLENKSGLAAKLTEIFEKISRGGVMTKDDIKIDVEVLPNSRPNPGRKFEIVSRIARCVNNIAPAGYEGNKGIIVAAIEAEIVGAIKENDTGKKETHGIVLPHAEKAPGKFKDRENYVSVSA